MIRRPPALGSATRAPSTVVERRHRRPDERARTVGASDATASEEVGLAAPDDVWTGRPPLLGPEAVAHPEGDAACEPASWCDVPSTCARRLEGVGGRGEPWSGLPTGPPDRLGPLAARVEVGRRTAAATAPRGCSVVPHTRATSAHVTGAPSSVERRVQDPGVRLEAARDQEADRRPGSGPPTTCPTSRQRPGPRPAADPAWCAPLPSHVSSDDAPGGVRRRRPPRAHRSQRSRTSTVPSARPRPHGHDGGHSDGSASLNFTPGEILPHGGRRRARRRPARTAPRPASRRPRDRLVLACRHDVDVDGGDVRGQDSPISARVPSAIAATAREGPMP